MDKAKADFAKAEITLTGGGTVYVMKEDPDDIKFYFDYCKRLGMPMMNVGPTAKTLPMIDKSPSSTTSRSHCTTTARKTSTSPPRRTPSR